MQPTFDASSSGNTGANTAASLTFSHVLGGGSNRFVLVGVHIANRVAVTVSSVTYNGVGMTALPSGSAESAGGWFTAFYYIKEANLPAAGTYNIVITPSANKRMVGTALSYADVEQTTTTGTPVTNNGSGTSATATVSLGADDVAADVVSAKGVAGNTQTLSTSLGQKVTNATTSGTNTNNVHGGASSDTTAARSWTLGFSAEWSIVSVPVLGIASDVLFAQALL